MVFYPVYIVRLAAGPPSLVVNKGCRFVAVRFCCGSCRSHKLHPGVHIQYTAPVFKKNGRQTPRPLDTLYQRPTCGKFYRLLQYMPALCALPLQLCQHWCCHNIEVQKAHACLIQGVMTPNGDARRLPTRRFRSRCEVSFNVPNILSEKTWTTRFVVSTSQEIPFWSTILPMRRVLRTRKIQEWWLHVSQ
jgi:hypothetical protein